MVYIVNHCNEWHEFSSFRLIGVFDEGHIKSALNEIQEELDYSDEDMDTYIDINATELNEANV